MESRANQSARPQIAILMAVYEPRPDWLREQLRSLNEQYYQNLALYVRDDCSSPPSYELLQNALRECITAFPYQLRRNDSNCGSNRTFELLTQEAEGEYFAYCDQDDCWLPDKLQRYEQVLRERKNALLVCSDMYIMDQDGSTVAESMTSVRRHHRFRDGGGLAKELLFFNFVTGCAMMLRAEQAKAAIPFCPYMVHDHYLAFFCARIGEIALIPEPLIRYRIHGGNQTLDMAGVEDKASYYRLRILLASNRLQWLWERFGVEEELRLPLIEARRWVSARQEYFLTGRKAGTVWKYRQFGRSVTLFELATPFLTNRAFLSIINLKRRNIL